MGAGQRWPRTPWPASKPGLPWGLIIGVGLLGAALGWAAATTARAALERQAENEELELAETAVVVTPTLRQLTSRRAAGRSSLPPGGSTLPPMTEAVFFATAAELRAWFEQNHATAPELFVGYWKKHTGKAGVTHPEAIEQALCFGWIDSIGRRIDEDRYQVRFTPRRKGSVWSAVNIAAVARLTEQGLMHPAGLHAFETARTGRAAIYSYEQPADARTRRRPSWPAAPDPRGLGVVLGAVRVVPQVGRALGDQRQARGYPGAPSAPS